MGGATEMVLPEVGKGMLSRRMAALTGLKRETGMRLPGNGLRLSKGLRRARAVMLEKSPVRWAAVGTHYASLQPGHPVYERLRGEWEAQDAADSQAVYDSIDAMLDRMRENSIANAALLAEDEPDEEDEDAARD